MEKDDYGCNKHETFDELMEFYKEAASTYDEVTTFLNLQCSALVLDTNIGTFTVYYRNMHSQTCFKRNVQARCGLKILMLDYSVCS